MDSDSLVRKVWKLVTESKSGVVWGDEQEAWGIRLS